MAVKNLKDIGGGTWTWTVTSSDPDDRGRYRTGPGSKKLFKHYEGKGFQMIQGEDFDLSKVKGVQAKLEREFS